MSVKLNGETVLEYTDPNPVGRGYIGLQLNEGQVEFKNIKLKRLLGLSPLFNGKDLTGWKNHPESKSTYTVTDKGEIHVTNTGRGASNRKSNSATSSFKWNRLATPPN